MALVTQGSTSGTWTPTFTGFSADPSIAEAKYSLVGKSCTINLRLGNGTSNATTFTFTLPFVGGTASQIITAIITDAGTISSGRVDVAGSSSNIATVYKTAAAGAFTATGSKSFNTCFTYIIG